MRFKTEAKAGKKIKPEKEEAVDPFEMLDDHVVLGVCEAIVGNSSDPETAVHLFRFAQTCKRFANLLLGANARVDLWKKVRYDAGLFGYPITHCSKIVGNIRSVTKWGAPLYAISGIGVFGGESTEDGVDLMQRAAVLLDSLQWTLVRDVSFDLKLHHDHFSANFTTGRVVKDTREYLKPPQLQVVDTMDEKIACVGETRADGARILIFEFGEGKDQWPCIENITIRVFDDFRSEVSRLEIIMQIPENVRKLRIVNESGNRIALCGNVLSNFLESGSCKQLELVGFCLFDPFLEGSCPDVGGVYIEAPEEIPPLAICSIPNCFVNAKGKIVCKTKDKVLRF